MNPQSQKTFIDRTNAAAVKQAEGLTTATTTSAPTTAQTTEAPAVENQSGPTVNTTTEAPAVTAQTTQAVVEDKNVGLLKGMNEALGTNFASLEEAQEAISKKELTQEERTKLDNAKEQELLATFIEQGKGTMDDYYRIKTLKGASDEIVAKANFAARYKTVKADATDDEINLAFNDHYFISEGTEFSDIEKAVGKEMMKADAEIVRNASLQPLNEVEGSITAAAKLTQSKKEWAEKVKRFEMPQSISIPIGVMGEKDFGTFEYPLKEDQLKDLREAIQDPMTLLKELQDPTTKKTDLNKLFEFLLWKRYGKNALVAASNHYHSKGIDDIGATLDNKPNLTNTTTQEVKTAEQNRQQGEKEAGEASKNILGSRNSRRKALPVTS